MTVPMGEAWHGVQNRSLYHVSSTPSPGPLHQLKELLYHFETMTSHHYKHTTEWEHQLTRDFSKHIATRWVHTHWQAAMAVTNTQLWVLQSACHTSASLSLVHRLFGRHTYQNSLVLQQHLQEQASQKPRQQRSTTYTRHKPHVFRTPESTRVYTWYVYRLTYMCTNACMHNHHKFTIELVTVAIILNRMCTIKH